ncbi:hypothetical protein I4U23_015115 [Adineta vaga]|nr:hypothetical protein I4U23_015115 [Adineta vaga]
MSSLRHIIVGCFLLFALSEFADGLQCYKCTNCNNPFTPTNDTITEVVDDEGYSCQKITARNVGTTRDIKKDCKEGNIKGIGTWCCKTDLCNGATSVLSSFHLGFVAISVITTIFFLK